MSNSGTSVAQMAQLDASQLDPTQPVTHPDNGRPQAPAHAHARQSRNHLPHRAFEGTNENAVSGQARARVGSQRTQLLVLFCVGLLCPNVDGHLCNILTRLLTVL